MLQESYTHLDKHLHSLKSLSEAVLRTIMLQLDFPIQPLAFRNAIGFWDSNFVAITCWKYLFIVSELELNFCVCIFIF